MNYKKILSLLLTFLFIICSVSCGGRKKSPPPKQDEQSKEKGTIIFANRESGNKNVMYRSDEGGKKKEKVVEKNVMGAQASGGKIAFVSLDEEMRQTLYLVNADGSGMVTVMNNTYINPKSISWSPDGSRIVYSSKMPSDKGSEIYYVEAGKYKTPIRVTDDAASNESPSFSNDGRFIIYAKNSGANYDIYKYEMGGANVNVSGNTANDISPVMSPDGTKILFISDEAEKGKYNLYYMNIDGGNRTRLTTGFNIEKDSIKISPDNSMIAFVTKGDKGSNAVHIIDMNKSTVLVSNGGYLTAWSGDSKALYFASSENENRRIVKYDIIGKEMKDVLKIQTKPGEASAGITFLYFIEKLK